MKVGIVTFIDYSNYGNRLQNYALQEYLRMHGFETETILNEKYEDYKYTEEYSKKILIHWIKSIIKFCFGLIMPRQKSFICNIFDDNLKKQRKTKNINFTNKYIKETKYVVREGFPHKRQLNQYDYLIAGSDQIWNPCMGAATDFFFLQNVPKEKRISFSASVGLVEIPKKRKEQWIKYINDMKYISVRERAAQKLINELTNKKATVLLDPTMIIERRVWDKLINSKSFAYANKRYIVTYILGKISNSEEEELQEIGRMLNAKIIRLNDRRYPKEFTADVIDFLQLITNARLVITDSFHACVFSILYYKQFYVLQRQGPYNNIYSRIEELLANFHLENHAVMSIHEVYMSMLNLNERKVECITDKEINEINHILEKERRNADMYINIL